MQKSGFVFTIFLLSLSIQGQVAGRYTDGKDYAVYFEQTRFGLTIKPVLWTATQLLKETTKDTMSSSIALLAAQILGVTRRDV